MESLTENRASKTVDYALAGMLGLLALLLLSELALSIRWRMQHDTPLSHYVAFLIDKHGYTPYKDVFETTMPGTLLFHLAIGKFLGYGDLAFRLVDVAYLSFLLIVTWLILRPFGRLVALTGPLLFGILYLGHGPSMSLQRDFIGILPLAIALLLSMRAFGKKRAGWRAFAIGALCALSASVKPHLTIGLPAIIVYMSLNLTPQEHRGRSPAGCEHLLRIGSLAALGFILVFALPLLWLWNKGGIPHFWEMLTSYLPLYLHLNGEHVAISGIERWAYLLKSYLHLGGMQALLTPVALGTYIAFTELAGNSSRIRLVLLLLTLLFLYSVYPVFSGQFWAYHWMPFVYFGCLCASLVLLPAPSPSSALYRRVIPVSVFAVFVLIAVRPARDYVRQVSGRPPTPPKEGRVDEIAAFLKTHMQPTDKVQPLDWTGGAVHGMLITRAVVATPYLYDYLFYHDISKPYIQELRRRFITRLKEEYPRFVIDVAEIPRPTGEDTTTEFPELQQFIGERYEVAYRGSGFTILERKSALAIP